jgi:hypothetical protein
MNDNSQFLKMYFESFAEHARQIGRTQPASCFDALAGSIENVSADLLNAYVSACRKIDDGKLDVALKQSIQQGVWSPASATEYMQRFMVFADGIARSPAKKHSV